MKKAALLAVLVALLFLPLGIPGCAYQGDFDGDIRYFYDEAHNVSIWLFYTRGQFAAMSVLPGAQVKSPQLPTRITTREKP